MYDKGLSVLERYGLSSQATYRGRGALICETQDGLKQIKPFEGSVKRLERQNQLLEHLRDAGHERLDLVLRNEEGSLVTTDREGYTYLVKNWWDGRECDARSVEDVLRGMRQLALLHRDMYLSQENKNQSGSMNTAETKPHTLNMNTTETDGQISSVRVIEKESLTDGINAAETDNEGTVIDPLENEDQAESLLEVYRKHNQGMKKIQSYVRRRCRKNDFEYLFLEHVGRYLEYGEQALNRLETSGYEQMRQRFLEKGAVCHGEYNQHNILIRGDMTTAVNFDHFRFEDQTADLAQFMRKIMEKHGWNQGLAEDMIESYSRVRPLSDEEWHCLAVRLSYPEKFWKIACFYYNNNKAFLSARHQEKLVNLLKQEHAWQDFMKSLFHDFL